jgi:DNA-binding HxlR family transcriptional regulator
MSESSTKSLSTTSTTQPGCVSVAVSILGDKWTPHIIRCLATGAQRFCRLQDDAGGINPRTLSARMSYLEEMGIVTKKTRSTIPPHTEYSLTSKGEDLLPILESMAAWGEKYGPAHQG